MPVTIEPIEVKPPEEVTLDIGAPVTFAQYSKALRDLHAEFMHQAGVWGWDKPSATIRRVTLEFPERRTSKVQPAEIGDGLTQDMFTPDGWAQFTAKAQEQYAARLVLFRKRILRMASEGFFDTDVANRILKAAGLPPYEQPAGFRYLIGPGPRLSFFSAGDEAAVSNEVKDKFREFFAANGWNMDPGYTVASVSQSRRPAPIAADQTEPLL